MSGSAKAGTLAERHRCDTVSSKDTAVRALPSAQGEVRVPLDKDLHGCRQTVEVVRETLVLYRMRPTVSAQVSREVGRGASDTAV